MSVPGHQGLLRTSAQPTRTVELFPRPTERRYESILDRGRYVRYDFSTATRLLEICQALKEHYGSMAALLGSAESERDLASRLLQFKGIGPVTARIFIRGIHVSSRTLETKRKASPEAIAW